MCEHKLKLENTITTINMYISSLCFLKFINSHEKIFKSVNNYYLNFTQVDFDSEKLFKNTRS